MPGLIYAGCHGLSVEGPDLWFTHPRARELCGQIADLARTLTERLRLVPGVELEKKDLAVAVHYRQAPPALVPEVVDTVERVRAAAGNGLTALGGAQVIELLPDVDWRKGRCACWIRDEWTRAAGRAPFTVYLGDDETDEDAFRALDGDALTIRIGHVTTTTAAHRRFAHVAGVYRFLAGLARLAERAR
jgi:trehalose-phosphatase